MDSQLRYGISMGKSMETVDARQGGVEDVWIDITWNP